MTLYFSSFLPLYIWSKIMLLAPVRIIRNRKSQNVSFAFCQSQYYTNLALLALMTFFEVRFMFWWAFTFKSYLENGNNECTAGMPFNAPLFASFIISVRIIVVFGIVMAKTNFQPLLSLHEILCYIDDRLESRPKPGKFKFVASFHICLIIFLLGMEHYVWNYNELGCWIIGISIVHAGRLMYDVILIQYMDIVGSIKGRFYCINVELQEALENYFRQDRFETANRRKFKVLPARTMSRHRVNELFQLFWLTCRGVQLVNATYGGIICAMLLTTSGHLISMPHFFLIPLFTTTRPLQAAYKLCVLAECLWMVCYCYQLFMLVVPPALASVEGSRTAVIVCKHLTINTEKNFLAELKAFVFRQNSANFEFMATHNLKLKLPLFTSVIGISATYLLMSLQIRNATEQ